MIDQKRMTYMGLAAFVTVIALMWAVPMMPSQAITGQAVSEPLAVVPEAVSFEPISDTSVASDLETKILQPTQEVAVEIPSALEIEPKTLDIEALIGQFPYKYESPSVNPHWQIVPERKSIELYATKKFVSAQVFDLARFIGDIDRSTKKEDITKFGLIKGFVYPQDQVIDWLNKDYKFIDKDEKRLADELIKLGVVKKDGDSFTWNPQYDGWPINAYSSAGVFRHERVHVIWLTNPEFEDYFMERWKQETRGLSKDKKVDFIVKKFDAVRSTNPPPSRTWWTAVYEQVGEENLVNEFTAHSIEKLPGWKGQTIAL